MNDCIRDCKSLINVNGGSLAVLPEWRLNQQSAPLDWPLHHRDGQQ